MWWATTWTTACVRNPRPRPVIVSSDATTLHEVVRPYLLGEWFGHYWMHAATEDNAALALQHAAAAPSRNQVLCRDHGRALFWLLVFRPELRSWRSDHPGASSTTILRAMAGSVVRDQLRVADALFAGAVVYTVLAAAFHRWGVRSAAVVCTALGIGLALACIDRCFVVDQGHRVVGWLTPPQTNGL